MHLLRPGFLLLLILLTGRAVVYAQSGYAVDAPVKDTVTNNCGGKTGAYFSLQAKYPESSMSLARRADQAIDSVRLPGIDGYITYRMIVDCKGKPTFYQLLQTDAQYMETSFPARVVNALYYFVRSLDRWKAAVSNKEPVSYRTYLSFKMKNGHVVAVSP